MPTGFSLCFTPRCLRLRVAGDTWEHCGAVAVLVAQGPNPPREVAPTAWDVHGVTALETDRAINAGDDLAMEWYCCLACAPTSAWPLHAWERRAPPDLFGQAEWSNLAIAARLDAAG